MGCSLACFRDASGFIIGIVSGLYNSTTRKKQAECPLDLASARVFQQKHAQLCLSQSKDEPAGKKRASKLFLGRTLALISPIFSAGCPTHLERVFRAAKQRSTGLTPILYSLVSMSFTSTTYYSECSQPASRHTTKYRACRQVLLGINEYKYHKTYPTSPWFIHVP